MAVSLPNGSLIHISELVSPAIAVTVFLNALEGAVTAAGHGLVVGDLPNAYVAYRGGWARASDKIYRVKSIAGDVLTLEGLDTQDVNVFTPGGGVGTIEKMAGWTQVTQILSSDSEGGEQQFKEYQFLEGDRKNRIPTSKNASGLTWSIADDPTLAGYIALRKGNNDRKDRGVRITTPRGAKILYLGPVTLNETPSFDIDELMAVEATLSFNEPVRYAT